MPMREPEKVRISPKAISTLWCISPIGGITNPAINSRTPNIHRTVDNISCTFFISVFSKPKLPSFCGVPDEPRGFMGCIQGGAGGRLVFYTSSFFTKLNTYEYRVLYLVCLAKAARSVLM